MTTLQFPGIRTLCILLTFIAMSGCKKTSFRPSFISFDEIGTGNLNGNEQIKKQETLITTAEDWKTLMDKMNTNINITNRFTEQDIDFENYDILACFDRIKPHTGHKIEIKEIVDLENNIVVIITFSISPQSHSYTAQPFHIVKVPKITKPVTFKLKE